MATAIGVAMSSASPDVMPVVNRLNHASKPKEHSFKAELCLDARKDAHRKALICLDVTAAGTQIEDAAIELGCGIDKEDRRRGIDLFPRLRAALSP